MFNVKTICVINGKEHMDVNDVICDLVRVFGYDGFSCESLDSLWDTFPYEDNIELYWNDVDISYLNGGQFVVQIVELLQQISFENDNFRLYINHEIIKFEETIITIDGSLFQNIKEFEFQLSEICHLPPLGRLSPNLVYSSLSKYEGMQLHFIIHNESELDKFMGGVWNDYFVALKNASLSNSTIKLDVRK